MLSLRLLSWIRNHSWFNIFLLGTLCIEEHQRSYILNSAQYLFRWVGKHFHVYFSHETNFLPSNQNEKCKTWHLCWNLSHKCMSRFNPEYTLESGIDVGQGITVGPGKFVKKNRRRALNKRRAWTKCANLCYKKPIKLENICRLWKKFQNLINVGPLIRL